MQPDPLKSEAEANNQTKLRQGDGAHEGPDHLPHDDQEQVRQDVLSHDDGHSYQETNDEIVDYVSQLDLTP